MRSFNGCIQYKVKSSRQENKFWLKLDTLITHLQWNIYNIDSEAVQ